jgi:hypothetical protein
MEGDLARKNDHVQALAKLDGLGVPDATEGTGVAQAKVGHEEVLVR